MTVAYNLRKLSVEMRLWHQSLLPYLDNKRLLAQHRECCALRGEGWGKKHSVVDYVFTYDLAHLCEYHRIAMCILLQLDYKLNTAWLNRQYRGKTLGLEQLQNVGTYVRDSNALVYAEHDDKYLKECLLNLKAKGAELKNGKTIDGWLIELDLKGVK